MEGDHEEASNGRHDEGLVRSLANRDLHCFGCWRFCIPCLDLDGDAGHQPSPQEVATTTTMFLKSRIDYGSLSSTSLAQSPSDHGKPFSS